MTVPPPIASPAPPDPGPEEPSHVRQLTAQEHRLRMEDFERRMAAEKARDLGQAAADALARRLWTIAGAAVVLVAGTASVVAWGQHAIDAGVAGKLEPVEKRIATVEQGQQDLKSDLHEVQKDIRELYRVLPTKSRRSERLEQPLPALDGGP